MIIAGTVQTSRRSGQVELAKACRDPRQFPVFYKGGNKIILVCGTSSSKRFFNSNNAIPERICRLDGCLYAFCKEDDKAEHYHKVHFQLLYKCRSGHCENSFSTIGSLNVHEITTAKDHNSNQSGQWSYACRLDHCAFVSNQRSQLLGVVIFAEREPFCESVIVDEVRNFTSVEMVGVDATGRMMRYKPSLPATVDSFWNTFR